MNLKADMQQFKLLMMLVYMQLEHMNSTYKGTEVLVDDYNQGLYEDKATITSFDIADDDLNLVVKVRYENGWYSSLDTSYHDIIIDPDNTK